MASEYLHVLMSLVIVIFCMAGLMFFLKKFRWSKNIWNKHIKIINMTSIGGKEKLILVEVNNVFLLLGATPAHIETLYVFNELADAVAVTATTNEKKNFSEFLKRISAHDKNGFPPARE